MGDTVSEFEEFLNWKKGRESNQRQEGILGEIRDHLKTLADALPGRGGENEGGEGGEGTPPAPPKGKAPEGGGEASKSRSRWFGEATG